MFKFKMTSLNLVLIAVIIIKMRRHLHIGCVKNYFLTNYNLLLIYSGTKRGSAHFNIYMKIKVLNRSIAVNLCS